MTSLRKLSKFIVGEELEISDLKNFSHLGGKLSILGLHYVVNISGAIHASLNSKDGIEELHMEWRKEFDDSRDAEIERQVLHHLQPPKSLRELEIRYYGGKELPWWIGDPSCAPNIVKLRIHGCKKLTSLPPLGRLRSLKELTLDGLEGITSVGGELSNLSALTVKNCPRLTGKLPSHLPSLQKLEIWNCPQLIAAPITTGPASLVDLHLDTCVMDECSLQVHLLSSLTVLTIFNISDLCSLNMLNSLPCLCELRISNCPRLVSFGDISLPSTLKRLDLVDCEAMKTLPLMHVDCFLERLEIIGCNSVESFPVVKEATSSELVCWKVKSLSIYHNNTKLPEEIMVHDIESLRIQNCPSLTCFPARGKRLPSTLKSLGIFNCENLETLTEGMLMQDNNNNMPLSLECIRIWGCPSLTCFSTVGKLPTSLKILSIQYCDKLAAIPETLPGSSLEHIDVNNCRSLEELPKSLVQHNLKRFSVSGCENLKSLSSQINSLTSLLHLGIEECPALRWPDIPQGGGLGLPLNLTSLTLGIGKTVHDWKEMCKWGLDNLTSLQSLTIKGDGMDDVISFPEYDYNDGNCFLPTSLTQLKIEDFKNLEALSYGLQNLISLKQLEIWSCPKLGSLPSQGLSSTLENLYIEQCPILGERCKKDGGHYWPIISYIPCVRIDNKQQ